MVDGNSDGVGEDVDDGSEGWQMATIDCGDTWR